MPAADKAGNTGVTRTRLYNSQHDKGKVWVEQVAGGDEEAAE